MVSGKKYLGFDIGTDSVGWAVSDSEYKILRYKGNLMWGVNLFDAASQASERRGFRTARRRLNRKKQRLDILREFFSDEISKVDEKFFQRLLESSLMPVDSDSRKYNVFFEDENYTDKDYYKQFPTIHHLICELMSNTQPHDVRLVYLACAYILGHRGHFLSEVDKDRTQEVIDFAPLADEFFGFFDFLGVDSPFKRDDLELQRILKIKKGVSVKENEFKKTFSDGKKISQPEEYPVDIAVLVKFIFGGTITLSKLFMNEAYEDLENNKVTVSSADFSDKLEILANELDDGDIELLLAVKKMHDWSLLVDILGGENDISKAKVKIYDEHKQDLTDLKTLCRKYLTKKENDEIFKIQTISKEERDKLSKNQNLSKKEKDEINSFYKGEAANYVRYIKNIKNAFVDEKPEKYTSCNQEEFCKFVLKYIEKIAPHECDTELYTRVYDKVKDNKLCPKQVTSDNRVIPYQLYYYELKRILENACRYLDFLNVSDEYGTVKDKILQTMLFRIPYYVGPLVSEEKSDFAWFERKAEGRITPWNFEDKVDLDKSEDKFIYNMTAKCSYLVEEDVLPKNSLLYCKFMVLNEINNIQINGVKIPVDAKQSIYEKLFMEKRKVSVKMIREHLKVKNMFAEGDILGGIDITVKSSLKSYHDFKNLLTAGLLSENDVENIIVRLTVSTDKPRIKKWLGENYKHLPDSEINYIAGLKYNDYGRLSEKLLTEIYEIDKKTGETSGTNIITRMWETNDNLMQILADNNGYKHVIEQKNEEYYSEKPKTLEEKLKAMYIPNAVRRSVIRTLDVAKELKKILPEPPEKIFIEMARGEGETKKGDRTKSRRDRLKEQFKLAKSFVSAEEIKALENKLDSLTDSELRSEKYYLYFNQFGKSMYSGKPIIFEEIGTSKLYDIDHIFPQSKVKDDSIDNKVLVLSEENGFKGDKYPVPSAFRNDKMMSFWKNLYDKEIISEKKYLRLTRATPFTNEELSGFINRQLVETRQSTKAVAQLLGEIFPDSEIIYVKAGKVSEFRHDFDMLKCREINDLHHAKDAYLNIVMGNVHDVKYTKNPMNIINNGEQYSLKLTSLLKHNIERNGYNAWNPDKSFAVVRDMMSRNSVRYVKYTYVKKGEYFNQNPLAAKEGLVPMKNGRDTSKYGGYANPAASHFALVNVKNIGNVFIPVEVISMNKYISDHDFAVKYAYDMLEIILSNKLFSSVNVEDISFPLNNRIIKLNTILDADGFRFNLCSKTDKGKYITISSAVSIVMDKKYEDYAKRISSFNEKRKAMNLKVSESDKITKEENLELYDLYTQKCITKPFSLWKTFEGAGKTLENGREKFVKLSVDEQVTVLMSVMSILKTGRSISCNLEGIGGAKMSCVSKFNAIVNANKGFKSIRIVDQSPTGLFEKYSENLITEI